jgi:hypothetical protein
MHPIYEYPTYKGYIRMEPAVLCEGYKYLLSDSVRRLLVPFSLMCLSADALERDSPVLEFEYKLLKFDMRSSTSNVSIEVNRRVLPKGPWTPKHVD